MPHARRAFAAPVRDCIEALEDRPVIALRQRRAQHEKPVREELPTLIRTERDGQATGTLPPHVQGIGTHEPSLPWKWRYGVILRRKRPLARLRAGRAPSGECVRGASDGPRRESVSPSVAQKRFPRRSLLLLRALSGALEGGTPSLQRGRHSLWDALSGGRASRPPLRPRCASRRVSASEPVGQRLCSNCRRAR